MNYELPKATSVHLFTNNPSYTTPQMQAAYQAGRKDALEDAAKEPLTNEQIRDIQMNSGVYSEDPWANYYSFAHGIEAAHGIKEMK